jgi:CBS-domain-containing membrane protein
MIMKKIQIFDEKIKTNYLSYILQCLLATLTLLAVLIFLDVLTETAIIAALGASAFIVFTMPLTYSSQPRRLIGGYIVGICVGFVFYLISNLIDLPGIIIYENTSLIFFGALSVGIAILIMTITNTEHAPAAGIALGLVINQWTEITIVFILVSILWMSLVRKLLKNQFINLTSPNKNS